MNVVGAPGQSEACGAHMGLEPLGQQPVLGGVLPEPLEGFRDLGLQACFVEAEEGAVPIGELAGHHDAVHGRAVLREDELVGRIVQRHEAEAVEVEEDGFVTMLTAAAIRIASAGFTRPRSLPPAGQ